MFGKPQRGVSERPHKDKTNLVPKWLWTLMGILLLIFAIVMLLLWRPWQPVNSSNVASSSEQKANAESDQEFRFYDLLPKQQVTPIPQQAVPATNSTEPDLVIAAPNDTASIDSDSTDASASIVSSEGNARYILQVRSYADADSADGKRAEVMMNGLAADVVQTEENGKTWYRVISGPYDSQTAALMAQQTLQNSGIDSIVVKTAN